MIVWVIIGIIALASIILGVSLHEAFWTLVGTTTILALILYIVTGFWDWLGEIGKKYDKKRLDKENKKQTNKAIIIKDKNLGTKVIIGGIIIFILILAIEYVLITF